MAIFKVVYEIEVEAENPLEAAKTTLEYIQDNSGLAQQFYVQEESDDEVKPIFSVDLNEEDEDAVLEIPTIMYIPLISK